MEALLAAGKPLTPETCGWHYVEGLTSVDDGRIAVFWDKAGLGHNGQRHAGSRTVYLLSMSREEVFDWEWEGFLREQEGLLAARREGGANAERGDGM